MHDLILRIRLEGFAKTASPTVWRGVCALNSPTIACCVCFCVCLTRAQHTGRMMPLPLLCPGTGIYLGSIPEAATTYNVIGNMNEYVHGMGQHTTATRVAMATRTVSNYMAQARHSYASDVHSCFQC